MRGKIRSLTALLPLLLLGCPAHTVRDDDYLSDRFEDEEEEEDREGREGREGRMDRRDREDREERRRSSVRLDFRKLPDVVVERSSGRGPRRNVDRVRQILCEGRENEDVIFFQLIVSEHWHYFWLCSERKARRVSSKAGARFLRRWLSGFQKQAERMATSCQPGSNRAVLQGDHESGVNARALCDGTIILRFPDGSTGTKRFQAPGGLSGGISDGVSGGVSGSGGSVACNCPPCPTCPAGGGQCPPCPPPRLCPPPTPCPPPKPCPKCDCEPQVLAAGKKGFQQGVDKACKRICQMIYTKCRQINPNTALCYQVSEYCAANCAK